MHNSQSDGIIGRSMCAFTRFLFLCFGDEVHVAKLYENSKFFCLQNKVTAEDRATAHRRYLLYSI